MSEGRTVTLTIDGTRITLPRTKSMYDAQGRPYTVPTTIYDASLTPEAKAAGIRIPVLCHQTNMEPAAVCRVCTVQVTGANGRAERVLAAACYRAAEDGITVDNSSERVLGPRRMLVELLMADHPSPCAREKEHGDCELERLAADLGVDRPRFGSRPPRALDDSSYTIAVDHSACILCDRCLRACTDIKGNNVIGRQGKGSTSMISFDDNRAMGDSSCVACGECMVSCPTGALTNQKPAGIDLRIPHGTPLLPDELLDVPVFANTRVSSAFLEKNEGSVVRRKLSRGEIVCREGEAGSTAFLIERGSVRVFLGTPIKHLRKEHDPPGGFFRRVKNLLVSDGEDPLRDPPGRSSIPIDAPVDLPLDDPVAALGEGDLFGEMSCLNFYPRSATVEAAEDTVLLEMNRNVLNILMKNREFREKVETDYRNRAMDGHLRNTPIFRDLPGEFLDYLRPRVGLVRFEPGDVICRQGEVADCLYLVRTGFVKVSQSFPGGELVLAYLSRGSVFGEMGLLAEEHVRTATCTAVHHAELVRIEESEFRTMLERFPEVRDRLRSVAEERTEENRKRAREVTSTPLDSFLAQGLVESTSLLVLDLEKCVRCDDCVRACAAAHDGVTRLVREGLRFDSYLVATSCRQCRDPLCMVGCPVGSIRRREGSREIVIEDWCIGCGVCADQCPYGNINMHQIDGSGTEHMKAQKLFKATSCDLDSHHTAGGRYEPACVAACPHDAAHRISDPRSFFGLDRTAAPSPSPSARETKG